MKKLVLLTIAYLMSSNAFASYVEHCEYRATVTAVEAAGTLDEVVNQRGTVASMTIEAAIDLGSHVQGACGRHLNRTVLLVVKDQEIKVGNKVTLEYYYADNCGPQGPIFSEEWQLIAIEK